MHLSHVAAADQPSAKSIITGTCEPEYFHDSVAGTLFLMCVMTCVKERLRNARWVCLRGVLRQLNRIHTPRRYVMMFTRFDEIVSSPRLQIGRCLLMIMLRSRQTEHGEIKEEYDIFNSFQLKT